MKKIYLFAAMATMLAACSENDLAVEKQSPQAPDAVEEAIVFNTYVNRSTTRAGKVGEMNLTLLKDPKAGFGVFGYYTDGERYASNTKPNFFYNQLVKWNDSGTGTKWEYTPIKYWPNEFGNDAISDQVDRVSLFAYAPYVAVDPMTGYVTADNTENITGLTRNNATGDPHVKYTATFDPTKTVDLCYGVAAEHFTSSNSTTANDIQKGKPFVDVTKPALGGIIKFDFKHSLAKLNVQIDAVVDDITATNPVNSFTKVWVRSVTFEGITMKGALNLRTGEWYQIDASGDNKISSGSVTVYDGLKDGREPIGKAANESPATLNPAIIQSLAYDRTPATLATALQTTDPTNVTGVTKDPQNLFKRTTDVTDPIYVIPTGEPMKVTIVYDVETYDSNLAYYLSDGMTQGSTIQNTITKPIDNFTELEPGKQYVLKLHLGMRSVEFDANVVDWDVNVNNAEADLPRNYPSFPAVSSDATPIPTTTTYVLGNITVADDNTEETYFSLRGLNTSSALTITFTESSVADKGTHCATASDSNGDADITGKFASVNNDVLDKKVTIQITDAGAGSPTVYKGGVINFIQKAHVLGLQVDGETQTAGVYNLSANDFEFVLTTTATGYTDWAASGKAATVEVYDADAPTDALAPGTDYSWTASTKTIEILSGKRPTAGNSKTFIIKVKAGDAAEETIKVKVTTSV